MLFYWGLAYSAESPMGLCFCCFFCFLQQSDLLTLQCGLVLAKWEGKKPIVCVWFWGLFGFGV